ncbi:MAG: hypothetical protein GF313_16540 [Caldithrix sp.]|nr:hypothetical protein [Caldithrix sp.]
MESNILIIGIDGGASKVSAWPVEFDQKKRMFSLGDHKGEISYGTIPGYLPNFKPVPVTGQLQERDNNDFQISDDEEQQGAVYVEACAQAIENVIKGQEDKKLLIGIGMPGLKTPDQRGIEVVANGPRIPQYCDLLEERLRIQGIELANPIKRMGSDADYCGIGENFSSDGLFRDIDHGYYLGGGTGVADAMKLNGELVPFDQAKSWIAKTWEMKNRQSVSLEKFASAGGIQSLYAQKAGRSVSELNEAGIYPMQIAELAEKDDEAAVQTFVEVVENISDLLFERISTLYAGWQNLFDFVNASKPLPNKEHPYQGLHFQRIILGQRLGELFASDSGSGVLAQPLVHSLQKKLNGSTHIKNSDIAEYRDIAKYIKTSKLREAPALGAGIDAFISTYES